MYDMLYDVFEVLFMIKSQNCITTEYVKRLLNQMIYYVDPFEMLDFLEEHNIPLPTFDDIDETEHEFSPEFHAKMAQLFKEVCGEDYVYPYPIKNTLTDSADSASTALDV